MDTANGSIGETKPVCQCASKPGVQRWLPGFPIALCLLMSLSSVTVCLLMSFKTYELENRLQMEMNKASVFHPPHRDFLNTDGTLVPELSTPIGRLVEEKVVVLMPKLRTTRDVGQECSCPPDLPSCPLLSGRLRSQPLPPSLPSYHPHSSILNPKPSLPYTRPPPSSPGISPVSVLQMSHYGQRERETRACLSQAARSRTSRASWWVISDGSRARVVWVHGEQPRRDPKRSQGMSEVMCEEDEERLDLAP
ncbi:hypothetical protein D9C73_006513 [Collichthys lucidus]|uniref:Collagen alpha-1(XXIII) chain n=1 Tax=Collichthys lucidus TaxID=240159 RepID=A0A4U5UDD9_COLLU|nr:hypothetical protein D9C73_006513 [Collichthys lucidus]